MIEQIIFLALGFLAATLLALLILPLVHARAVRLTKKRIEAAAPDSITAIQADKDQLRAEFAMTTRRLELGVEQLKAKATQQLADVGKKTETVAKLKGELGEKVVALTALETRERALREQLQQTEESLAGKAAALQDVERKLAERDAELAKLGMSLQERSVEADNHRIEIVALKTQLTTLRDHSTDVDKELKHTQARLARERGEAERLTRELEETRGRAEAAAALIAQLERRLASQTAEAERLTGRVVELEAQGNDQGRQLGEFGRDREQLRADLEAARRLEADLRRELAAADERHDNATEAIRAEKALLEGQLERAREERGKLQREMAALKRNAESTWEAERVENAMLRERINDVSAEVARLSAALEGPTSPIETILSEYETTSRQGRRDAVEPTPFEAAGRLSLADRIRALQGRAAGSAAAG